MALPHSFTKERIWGVIWSNLQTLKAKICNLFAPLVSENKDGEGNPEQNMSKISWEKIEPRPEENFLWIFMVPRGRSLISSSHTVEDGQ